MSQGERTTDYAHTIPWLQEVWIFVDQTKPEMVRINPLAFKINYSGSPAKHILPWVPLRSYTVSSLIKTLIQVPLHVLTELAFLYLESFYFLLR